MAETVSLGKALNHGLRRALENDSKVVIMGEDGEAVIAYFGDGATSQGDVNEAFIWASVNNAPIVFFCQNNQYAISEPSERQTRVPLYRRAAGFGVPGVRVDGNDVLATYAVTRSALDHARHGQGPMLIEAYTYRMGAHTSSDDPTRYRIASEVEAWKAKDPISRLKAFLTKQQVALSAAGSRCIAFVLGFSAAGRRCIAHQCALPSNDAWYCSNEARWATASPASGSTATTCWPASRSPGPRSTRPGRGRGRR